MSLNDNNVVKSPCCNMYYHWNDLLDLRCSGCHRILSLLTPLPKNMDLKPVSECPKWRILKDWN